MARSMIVGRTSRSHIVGAQGMAEEMSELTGALPPPPPPGHPAYGGHPGMHPGMQPGHYWHHTPYSEGYGAPLYSVPAAGPVAYGRDRMMRVIEEEPRHEREFPIGFTSPVNVPADGQQLIQALPQVLFRGERLAVPNSIVLNFQLSDIKVGKNSQLAAPGNLPAECFSNVSIGVRMQLETAEPGITITLVVVNTDANNSHAFSSVLYGTVLE